MSNWEKVKVKDVCTIVNGGTPKTSVEEYWNSEDVVWITPTDITQLNSKYISDSSRKISTKGLSESSATLLPVGSVLMCSRATIGPCAINTIPVSTNQGFKSFICSERINNEYLYYLISILKDYFIDNASGSTFLEVSKSVVENCELMLPPLKEQQKIAEILSSVDAAIEKTEQVIAKTEEVKKGLMQQLLTKGIGHTEFKESHLGSIPKPWDCKMIGNVCELKGRIGWKGYTKNDLRDSGPLVIGATQISKTHKLDLTKPVFISREKYEESPEIQIIKGDIIIVKTGNTIGKVALIEEEIGEATINPNTVLIKNCSMYNRFLYYILISNIVQKILSENITVGAQPSINQDRLRKIYIPVPPLEEQEKIVEIIDSVQFKIGLEYENLENLFKLKKGLMQQLLTGQVRVKID